MSFKDAEFDFLPPPVSDGMRRRCRVPKYALYVVVPCAMIWVLLACSVPARILYAIGETCGLAHRCVTEETMCPQVEAMYPQKNSAIWKDMADMISADAFRTKAVNWLAGAVQIPSESFDEMDPVGLDPRWEVFGDFHDHLLEAFPLVHKTLKLEKVNTYGLLYEWTGSDTALKPALLTAHQDVVPVDPTTFDQWNYPPFSGHYDGTRLWGRGSSDDKSGLIGILITFENLIERGFKPTRTVVAAFGFDEEASGLEGASKLADAMLKTYGKEAFAFIVDEGEGFAEVYGSTFATPGVAEKGYLDTRITVAAPGGHSSVPPAHTSIGMLAAMLVEIERNQPVTHLSREDIMYESFQCFATHGKTVPKKVRQAVVASVRSEKALRIVEDYVFSKPSYYSAVTTTQAIDLISGGVKTNALPEQASAIINHRISTLSSVEAVMARDTATVKGLAEEFNLTITSFGEPISAPDAPSKGSVVLSDALSSALAPATRTPSDSLPYQMLSGTIKATYNSHRGLEGSDNIAVSPGMSTGNTDTQYYWDLTRHIFRYNHMNSYGPDKRISSGLHTVNENIEVDTFIELIRFFTTLILNADEVAL